MMQPKSVLRANARNARPARLPTMIPMIVDIESLLEPPDEDVLSVVEVAVGPAPPKPSAVCVWAPDPFVAVAGIVAGFAAGLYPFSLQY